MGKQRSDREGFRSSTARGDQSSPDKLGGQRGGGEGWFLAGGGHPGTMEHLFSKRQGGATPTEGGRKKTDIGILADMGGGTVFKAKEQARANPNP